MALTFLTPLAALVAVAALLPLAVSLRRERRAAAVRERLGLPEAPRGPRLRLRLALVALPLLVGLAAAQPVLDLTEERRERTDVETWIVLDTSRSMLAASGPQAPTRLARAQRLAAAVRDELPQVPTGLASLTDRALPHLFPTTDRAVFATALETSIGIERPPPRLFFSERATDVDAVAAVLSRGYFSPDARRRVLVLLTDGETRAQPAELPVAVEGAEGLEVVLVPVWAQGERVYAGGAAEPGYEADPEGPATLERLARETRARLVPDEPAAVAAAVAEAAGEGPTRVAAREGRELALMPWIAGLAALPLALVLWRRNL